MFSDLLTFQKFCPNFRIFIGHNGEIDVNTQQLFQEYFWFCHTEDGEFNQTVLVEVFNKIEK